MGCGRHVGRRTQGPTHPGDQTVLAAVTGARTEIDRLVFPGGDTSISSNVEYRIPIVGPVTLAAFMDAGYNFAVRQSQLRLSSVQFADLNSTLFGCSSIDPTSLTCLGGRQISVGRDIKILDHTNYVPRMSTGLELQVIMPIVNAPFRFYYAYNPLRMDTLVTPPAQITRDMFPLTDAGTYTYQQVLATYGTAYHLREPRRTFRFTVSTTF